MIEKTLSIIKPDAVRLGYSGKIIALIETAGFKILGLSMVHMTQQKAQLFYDVHREKPFFNSLTEFMSSGPSIVMVIESSASARPCWVASLSTSSSGPPPC